MKQTTPGQNQSRARAGQGRAGQGRAGQGRAGRYHAGKHRHNMMGLEFRAEKRDKNSKGPRVLAQNKKRRRG